MVKVYCPLCFNNYVFQRVYCLLCFNSYVFQRVYCLLPRRTNQVAWRVLSYHYHNMISSYLFIVIMPHVIFHTLYFNLII